MPGRITNPIGPGKLTVIPWVYAEIARVLAEHEPLEILCHSREVMESARVALDAHNVRHDRIALHLVPTDRVWLRDSAPTGVIDAAGDVVLLNWAFNGWAKYSNWQHDIEVGGFMARLAGLGREEPPARTPVSASSSKAAVSRSTARGCSS